MKLKNSIIFTNSEKDENEMHDDLIYNQVLDCNYDEGGISYSVFEVVSA